MFILRLLGKPSFCQRPLIKASNLRISVERTFSARDLTKSSLSAKAKFTVGVVSLSGLYGCNYFFGFEKINRLLPVAKCESTARDFSYENEVEKKKPEDQNRKESTSDFPELISIESLDGSTPIEPSTSVKFSFQNVLHMLKCDIRLLCVAVTSALAVAALNIQIPQLLGQIINVVARSFVSSASNEQGLL